MTDVPREVKYRDRVLGEASRVVLDSQPSTKCWMIRWENLPYLFASLDAAKESVELTYTNHMIVMSVDADATKVFDVIMDGRIQDRITVMEIGILDGPVTLPGRRTTPIEF